MIGYGLDESAARGYPSSVRSPERLGPNGLSIMAVTPPAFLDLKEAAALLGVSEALFLRLVHQGKIQIAANALIFEGKLYFLRTDLPHLNNKQPGS